MDKERLKTSSFDYPLPEHLIAHSPAEKRDESRLLHLTKGTSTVRDMIFKDLPRLLGPNDVLVVNNTKVLQAKLFPKRQSGAQLEVLLLNPLDNHKWHALIKKSRRLKVGEILELDGGARLELLEKGTDGKHTVRLIGADDDIHYLDNYGHIPLPPYIENASEKKQLGDRYQTVYANKAGAIAAPTAGLHFTPEILDTLKSKGVQIHEITLHVGYGTFKPMDGDYIHEHVMHHEHYQISSDVAEKIMQEKRAGKRIIAVGTTVVRTLESAWKNGQLQAGSDSSNLFISPGYSFKVIDGLITNFHLPKSTLMCLVSALAGLENIMSAYHHAIEKEYRFFSFGDAMAILP